MTPTTTTPEQLRQAVDANPVWYHTIELAPGIVTPGRIDLREIAKKILPESLEGRALDIGTFDGFWAFELERRGAETVAIDLESAERAQWPPINRPRLEAAAKQFELQLGRGFKVAHEALGSNVQRYLCSITELTPEAIEGSVRYVFLGSLLLHLRDPVGALENVLNTLEPGGTIHLLEPIDVRLTALSPRKPAAAFQPLETDFNWWYPNLATLRGWLRTAGFENPKRHHFVRPPAREDMKGMIMVSMTARRPA